MGYRSEYVRGIPAEPSGIIVGRGLSVLVSGYTVYVDCDDARRVATVRVCLCADHDSPEVSDAMRVLHSRAVRFLGVGWTVEQGIEQPV